MKKFLFVYIPILILAACQAPAETESADDGNSNIDVVQGMYDAFAEGNIEAVLGAMDSTVVWNEAEGFVYADNNPYVGPQAVLEGVFARIGGEWENFSAVPDTLRNLGDNGVLAEGRYNGVYKANGMSFDAAFAHVWQLNEGKVVSFQQYTDTKQAHEVVSAEAPEADGDSNDTGS